MKLAYFDCFSGISGDMILGALVDLGLELDLLKRELEPLALTGYQLKKSQVKRAGLAATKVDVLLTDSKQKHTHTTFAQIKNTITSSGLKPQIKELSLQIFQRLAQAEAKVHDTPLEQVAFHEVGNIDAMVDIVGAAVGLNWLRADQLHCSPVNVGSGYVQCHHGLLPVPAPATLQLLRGVPVYTKGPGQELATPTGAAIITTAAQSYGTMPAMVVEKVGYGAGKRDHQLPNLLRVLLGTPYQAGQEVGHSHAANHAD